MGFWMLCLLLLRNLDEVSHTATPQGGQCLSLDIGRLWVLTCQIANGTVIIVMVL